MLNSISEFGYTGEEQSPSGSVGYYNPMYAEVIVPLTEDEMALEANFVADNSLTPLRQVISDLFAIERIKQATREAHDYATSETGPYQIVTAYGSNVGLNLPQLLSHYLCPLWKRKEVLCQVRHISPENRYNRQIQVVALSGKLKVVPTHDGSVTVFDINPKGPKWRKMIANNLQLQMPLPLESNNIPPVIHTLAYITGRTIHGSRLGFLADPQMIYKANKGRRAHMMVNDFEMVLNDDNLAMPWTEVAAQMSQIEDVEVDIGLLESNTG